MEMTNKWFPFGCQRDIDKEIRVFCFHFAGGSSAAFKHWTTPNLPVEFIPVELPGRGVRISEACMENFDDLIEQLMANLIKVLDYRRFHFFGHSMGAVIAFEAAYQLQDKFGILPEQLIVAGRHAPHHPDPSLFQSYMSDEALIAEIKRLDGTPKEILENREVMQFLLPMIRSDYKLHESYNYRGNKLNIPIIAHAGTDDPEADASLMQHWSEVTDGTFELQQFAGNHFFVQNLRDVYLVELINKVRQKELHAL
ncbi:thioesterase II family protein [Paenibacillus sp. 481]|uniref:thioesterase II family protein n=1 Tax=Paenibacillus sp. 481 TaxID=2835869 RepID=UPI001E64B14F|nr:alpha/beta fold hydrolase [Paenibacillus sp. 481]UHA73200.1 thioesterase [Paenibacillus sp. 481]